MARQSRQERRLDAIRSVSIEDIVHGRHTRWRRFLRKARTVLTVVGLLGLPAAAGGAVYFIWNGPGDEAIVASTTAAPRPAPVLPKDSPVAPLPLQSHLAALSGLMHPDPMATETGFRQPGATVPTETAALTPPVPDSTEPSAAKPSPEEEPVDLARLPSPRPDEPIVTGSIARPVRSAPRPAVVESRRFHPCHALRRLTSHLPSFAHVSCDR